jgi:hypothetical protein
MLRSAGWTKKNLHIWISVYVSIVRVGAVQALSPRCGPRCSGRPDGRPRGRSLILGHPRRSVDGRRGVRSGRPGSPLKRGPHSSRSSSRRPSDPAVVAQPANSQVARPAGVAPGSHVQAPARLDPPKPSILGTIAHIGPKHGDSSDCRGVGGPILTTRGGRGRSIYRGAALSGKARQGGQGR